MSAYRPVNLRGLYGTTINTANTTTYTAIQLLLQQCNCNINMPPQKQYPAAAIATNTLITTITEQLYNCNYHTTPILVVVTVVVGGGGGEEG